jgi:hypothetical protein
MGCSDCARSGGCSTRKADERSLLAEVLARVYPDRRWGAPDDAARFRAGIGEVEGRRLARRMAAGLEAPTTFRSGDDTALGDMIYVLCVGRAPALVDLRDREAAGALEALDGERVRERYLRVALSSVARIAAVQEVALELDREGETFVFRERPRDGVYDPILLRRTQRLIELLVESDIAYLDFGLLAKPPGRYLDGFTDDDYRAEYGQPADTVNYLFYPQPSTVVGITYVPAGLG